MLMPASSSAPASKLAMIFIRSPSSFGIACICRRNVDYDTGGADKPPELSLRRAFAWLN
jgi:hypothetical protein